tara:strand:- start:334 stop:474 length:141 start_codon:yes stop_codon:yes gene_type:complete
MSKLYIQIELHKFNKEELKAIKEEAEEVAVESHIEQLDESEVTKNE